MDFEREEPKCKFSIPDRPTVRQQLEYFSLAGGLSGKDMLIRYWNGAKALIQSWECELLPDYKTTLETVDDPDITSLIIWAGLEVRGHMNGLDTLPKN